MPNHIHTILSTKENLSDIVRDFKQFTSRGITKALQEGEGNRLLKYFRKTARTAGRGNDFMVWQTGSLPISISGDSLFRQKLDYIHNNPVRKGYVDSPEHWIYSSARNYFLGDDSILPIDLIE